MVLGPVEPSMVLAGGFWGQGDAGFGIAEKHVEARAEQIQAAGLPGLYGRWHDQRHHLEETTPPLVLPFPPEVLTFYASDPVKDRSGR